MSCGLNGERVERRERNPHAKDRQRDSNQLQLPRLRTDLAGHGQ